MLLKCSPLDKRPIGQSKGGKNVRNPLKMTVSSSTTSMSSRIHRKVLRVPSKRHPGKVIPSKLTSSHSTGKLIPGKRLNLSKSTSTTATVTPTNQTALCDNNSNDSGLGFDRNLEHQYNNSIGGIRSINQNRLMTTPVARNSGKLPGKRAPHGPITLQTQLSSISRDGKVQLQILTQPEQQHRARYQTEGSRGAVKDRSGNGFPVVRLVGYNKPAILQVFIGTDVGRVLPHMFYQACKVSGKNSTQCVEKKQEGTIVIEIELKSENDMTVTCDCVGILKERNVDVEHRFPDQQGPRSKKKSTRCRMVFRTIITNLDGSVETLQVCSQQIVCTQPPGVPEISKKSLVSSPVDGGLELFIIGKNFLKDTRVIFQKRKLTSNTVNLQWEESVVPDKEYLQQTHLVCIVPPYLSQDILEPTTVQIFIVSGGKKSETHNFTYTPKNSHTALTAATTSYFHSIQQQQQSNSNSTTTNHLINNSNSQDAIYDDSSNHNNNSNHTNTNSFLWNSTNPNGKNELDSDMMPPPVNLLPLCVRRPSLLAEQIQNISSPPSQSIMKSELIIDENTRSPINETLNPDSLERFPGSSDNSLDNNLMYRQTNSVVPTAMDISEDNSNISMIVNDGTIDMNTINHHRNLHHPMSTIINETGLNVFHPATASVPPAAHIMNNIMDTNELNNSRTTPNANDLKVIDLCIKQEQMDAAVKQSQLVQFIAATTNSNDPIPNINEVNELKAQLEVETLFNATQQPSTQIETTFPTNMMNHHHDAQLLGMQTQQNTIIPTSVTANPQQQPQTIDTTVTQDIILNSQSAITITTNNLPLLATTQQNQTNVNSATQALSPEIILNPTVAPSSIMCQNTNDPNLLTSQVLNNMAVMAASQQAQAPPPSTIIPPMIEPTPEQKATSANVVKNMILNAAAEILTTNEPSVTTQTTINALMSLNTSNILTNSVQQTQMMSNVMMDHSLVSQTAPQQMPVQESQQQQQQALYQTQLTMNNSAMQQQTQPTNQESLLQNVNLMHSHHHQQQQQQPHMHHHQIHQNNILTDQLQQQQPIKQAQQQPPTPSTIPQELTSMSDNDLISYINPSCFDQV
uniref:Nuclear factor of activated T-cells 5 n=1 Tax=Corethrella appendiculata TaxID=1370023 RepID=U5EFX6_9DIPT